MQKHLDMFWDKKAQDAVNRPELTGMKYWVFVFVAGIGTTAWRNAQSLEKSKQWSGKGLR